MSRKPTERHIAAFVPNVEEDDGFGTLVENLASHASSPDIRYTVFGNWFRLVAGVLSGCDAVLLGGIRSGLTVKILKAVSEARIIVRLGRAGGHRGFAGFWGKAYERMAVMNADTIVTDNRIVLGYVMETYGRNAVLIPNGGDHLLRTVAVEKRDEVLDGYGLEPGNYAIAEGRISPDHSCGMILEAYSRTLEKIVFLGDWDGGEYARRFKRKYSGYPNIRMVPAPEDPDAVHVLRDCSRVILHGYGDGDTVPSLLSLMWAGKPVICLDSVYNREITRNQACYFTDVQDIIRHVFVDGFSGKSMLTIAGAAYVWKHVARQYEMIYEK